MKNFKIIKLLSLLVLVAIIIGAPTKIMAAQPTIDLGTTSTLQF